MIDQVKKNISFILIFIAIFISVKISLDGTVDDTKYKSQKVPVFRLPAEITPFSHRTPTQFSSLEKSVLLGEEYPIKLDITPPKKSKPRLSYRRLKVKAIMIEGKDKIANINGSMLKVGERINGRIILKIQKNGVLVTGPNGKQLIKIKD